MTQYGLLIDYEFCTGCHTCEMACKVEHGFAEGEWGIKLMQNGPTQIGPDEWEFNFIPVPTKRCDLCADRVAEGRLPTCVHHCQALVMEYGPVEELARQIAKSYMVLFVPDGAKRPVGAGAVAADASARAAAPVPEGSLA